MAINVSPQKHLHGCFVTFIELNLKFFHQNLVNTIRCLHESIYTCFCFHTKRFSIKQQSSNELKINIYLLPFFPFSDLTLSEHQSTDPDHDNKAKFLDIVIIRSQDWGAMIRGRGKCGTFQSFKLTYLHILRS